MRSFLIPIVLPLAAAWVAQQERRILAAGAPLDAAQSSDAAALGVHDPARVRLLHVDRVPFPAPWITLGLDRFAGFSIGQTAGLSARHGIFVRSDMRGDRRLLAHELAHTRQYERLGGIRPFLRRYLRECLTAGYGAADLELEAGAAARAICG